MSTSDESCCAPGCCNDGTTTTLTRNAAAKTGAAATTSAVGASPGGIPAPASSPSGEETRAMVRERYAAAAKRAAEGELPSCGCGTCCGDDGEVWDPITSELYAAGETEGIPTEALLASLGCGNPTALAALSPGEVVLDLGSGGGIDVLLSARRVGPAGHAYGLDMTDEMLALARENQRRAGATNVTFLRGEIEHIPLPNESVDVIISNCVINLSADKAQVLREAFRVLRPGGRLAVSDVVLRGDLPPAVRESVALFTGCVAGALEEGEYLTLLRAAGFRDVSVEPTRIYSADDARALVQAAGLDAEVLVPQVEGRVMSAFVRGVRP
jgi:SAM-dependent methyltransferase